MYSPRVLIPVALSLALPVHAAQENAATIAVRKTVTSAYALSDSAFTKGDMDAYFVHFAPDAKLTENGQTLTLVQAKPAIASLFKQWKERKQQIVVETVVLQGASTAVATNSQTVDGTINGQRLHLTAKNRDVWNRIGGSWKITLSETLSQQMTSSPDVPTLDAATEKAVVGEIKAQAIPLKTVEAGNGFVDLEAVGKAIGDSRIVSLGEASHGTREFFQMKHRMLEYLVNQKGFTVFAIEANFPESLAVDRYITTGEGDPKKALAGMYFWTWNTEEVLALIEWMRTYNKAPGTHPTLHFSSFDMQTADVALDLARDYLKQKANAATASEAVKYYVALSKLLAAEQKRMMEMQTGQGQKPPTTPAPTPAQYATAAKEAEAVIALFEREKETLIKSTSKEAFDTARQAAVVAVQAAILKGKGPAGYSYRDESMAANTRWLAETAYPGQNIVLWAHNGHVGTSSYGGGVKSMGESLRQTFGTQMYVIGFAFDHGEIRALPMAGGRFTGMVQPLPVPPAKPGTGDALLNSVGEPRFFLDFRTVTADSPLGTWLHQPAAFRMPGAAWATDNPDAMAAPLKLADTFDGLIFISESHASHPVTEGKVTPKPPVK